MYAIVVVPTIREQHIKQFLKRWNDGKREFIVIEDHAEKQFDLSSSTVMHYCHADIDRDLGDDAWIISRGNSGIRSYGFWKAWQKQPDMIVTLDDDCYPVMDVNGFFLRHWENLQKTAEIAAWRLTIGGLKPRGYPYRNLTRKWPVVLSHGLWEGIPDLDALWQLAMHTKYDLIEYYDDPIPAGRYFPMCGMNLAFNPAIAPLMYFGLQGPAWPYDRFDDIWCGVIAKKVLDRLQLAVWSGEPHVKHERASDVWGNLRKEAVGLEFNETFWEFVDIAKLTGTTAIECYLEIAHHFAPDENAPTYLHKLRSAMEIWAGLFR